MLLAQMQSTSFENPSASKYFAGLEPSPRFLQQLVDKYILRLYNIINTEGVGLNEIIE